ncbi:hypothetical protein TA3x_000118 [Tundrisphaera sp. TA3]|uniref:hypothetical protein n=1 Tax=Tundrisphaera sp. TA3 TaxID=3435775 RepID=UPI003EBB8FC2
MRRSTTFGLALACLAIPLLIVFRPALFQGRQFAFQDAGHYYYPLLQRVQQEWDAGRWPLWAPEASAGTPLLGNPTAAVLYPGKVVFALMPFPWAMRAYLIGHVALAFGAMWALLRGWRVSATGALIGALAYGFGVPVLSQTSNMIFLVGAAWGPLGFLAADGLVRCRRRMALPALGLVLAFEVLGGDPEMAYLTVICAGGYAAGIAVSRSSAGVGPTLRRAFLGLIPIYLGLLGLSWWTARAIHRGASGAAGPTTPWSPPRQAIVAAAWAIGLGLLARRAWRRADPDGGARGLATSAFGLLAASALALAIAGAQALPVAEAGAESFRAAESQGFHDIYPYNVHPLQFLDATWPGVFGTLEGGYRSWLNALPPKPESRLWMPSVYLGGLALVLALSALGMRGGPPWRAWLSVVAIAGALAALGPYGGPLMWARYVPGWAATLGPPEPAFSWQVRTDGHLRDGDGGAYWLLASAFPGFGSFRYPAKLLVVWSLAVAGLAGIGWDRLLAGHDRRARRIAALLLGLGVATLLASWSGAGTLRSWFDALALRLRASDEPLDAARAIADIRSALVHGVAVAAFALGVATLAARRPRLAGAVAVLGLGCDLVMANAHHVITVPQSAFEGTPRALELIREAERADPSPGPFRVQRVGRWWPARWADPDGSPRDFDAITRWEHRSLRTNYNLPLGVESTFYFDTLEPVDYGSLFLPWSLSPPPETLRAHKLRPDQPVWYYPRRAFDLWNTRYFIVPAKLVWESPARGYASFIPKSTFLYPKPGTFDGPDGPALRAKWGETDDFRILRNENAYPRAWVVHRASILPPIRGMGVAERADLTREILYQGDEFWRLPGVPVQDPRTMAWVETDRPAEVDALLSRALPDPAEVVAVDRDEPQRVEMTATLLSPGLVVVADRFDPGWTLAVDGRPAEIHRTNRAMRGVALPAGTHRLVFRYDPRSFRLGKILTAIGLAAFVALAARAARWPARPRDPDLA